MKLCKEHQDHLTGDGECFMCQITELRKVNNECQVEIRELKRLLAEKNIQLPQ